MISTVLVATALAVAGPCDLLDRATASSLLGAPVKDMEASPPARDEETGGTVTVCWYRSDAAALIVSQMTFANPAAARQATTKELVEGRMEDEATALKEVPGVGDRAFWITNEAGAQFVILKGATVLGVALGGLLPKPLASYEAALRAAATAAAAKL